MDNRQKIDEFAKALRGKSLNDALGIKVDGQTVFQFAETLIFDRRKLVDALFNADIKLEIVSGVNSDIQNLSSLAGRAIDGQGVRE